MASEPTRIGQHLLWQDGDIAVLRLVGPFTAADAPPVHAFFASIHAARGRCFVLADVTAMTRVEPEARRYAAEWNATRRLGAIAVVGASAPIRVISSLLITAIGLLHKRPTAPVEFLKDEAEARRWLATQRVGD